MTTKTFSPYRCTAHPNTWLVDVLESDGSISQCCPDCVAVDLISVVRALYVRRTA